jgi:hypothetical protein
VSTDPAICSECALKVDDEDLDIARIKEFAARGRTAQAAVDDATKDPDPEEGLSEEKVADDDETPEDSHEEWLRRVGEEAATDA